MHTHIFSVCLNVCELTSGSVASPKTETYEIIGEVCPDAVLLLSRAKALTFTVGNIWNVALMPIIAQPNVPLKHVTNHRNSPTALSRVSELCCSCRFVMLLYVVWFIVSIVTFFGHEPYFGPLFPDGMDIACLCRLPNASISGTTVWRKTETYTCDKTADLNRVK